MEKWNSNVGECISTVIDSQTVKFVDYQPGNGTRYSVCFTFLGNIDSEKAKYQIGGHDTIVSIENFRRCMTVGAGTRTSAVYVAEKLNMNMADAEPITALINHVCNKHATAEYNNSAIINITSTVA